MTLEEIKNKVEHSKDLNFSDIFDKAIDMFKKVWLQGFLVILMVMILSFALAFLMGLIGLGSDPFNFNNGFDENEFLFSTYKSIVFSIPQTIIVSIFTLGLLSGFYRMVMQKDLNNIQQDDYFYYFKKAYFSKIVALGFIYAGIATIAQLLCFFPYIYVFVPLSYFAIMFANNSDLNEIEIVKASFSIGNKKWLITFGTMFVSGLLAMLGIIACGIGILFTMSLVYLPVYFIYKDVIGFEDNDDIKQIGTPLER